jgi:hypothetical protein
LGRKERHLVQEDLPLLSTTGATPEQREPPRQALAQRSRFDPIAVSSRDVETFPAPGKLLKR